MKLRLVTCLMLAVLFTVSAQTQIKDKVSPGYDKTFPVTTQAPHTYAFQFEIAEPAKYRFVPDAQTVSAGPGVAVTRNVTETVFSGSLTVPVNYTGLFTADFAGKLMPIGGTSGGPAGDLPKWAAHVRDDQYAITPGGCYIRWDTTDAPAATRTGPRTAAFKVVGATAGTAVTWGAQPPHLTFDPATGGATTASLEQPAANGWSGVYRIMATVGKDRELTGTLYVVDVDLKVNNLDEQEEQNPGVTAVVGAKKLTEVKIYRVMPNTLPGGTLELLLNVQQADGTLVAMDPNDPQSPVRIYKDPKGATLSETKWQVGNPDTQIPEQRHLAAVRPDATAFLVLRYTSPNADRIGDQVKFLTTK